MAIPTCKASFKRIDPSEWEFDQPIVGERYELESERKSILTAGSVRQLRDDDPRALLLTIDGGTVRFTVSRTMCTVTVAQESRDPRN